MAQQDSRRIVFTQDARFAVTPKADDSGPGTLKGYAIVWNVLSTDRGGYKVRLLPGSAKFATPTHALYHHDFRDLLGDTESGTLRILPADDYGVPVEIDLPNTTLGRDVHELVKTKRVKGMSFAMVSSPRSKATRKNGQDILEVDAFAADEVTVTAIPAFVETTIGVKPPPSQHSARTDHAIRLAKLKLDLYRPDGVVRAAV